VQYAELHCRTNYSFQEGASHADELAARAKELGYTALSVTDRNSLAGVVRAHVAAKEAGLRLLVGAEIIPEDGPAMVLLAMDRPGYGRLSRLITTGRRRSEKGACRILLQDVAEASAGLLCGVPLSRETQLRYRREYQPRADMDVPDNDLLRLQRIFGDRCYALAELHHGPLDSVRLQRWLGRCSQLGIPVAAANDVHFHIPRRRPLQEVLTAIRCGVPLQGLGHELFPNGERYLKSIPQLQGLFRGHRELLDRTVEAAARCPFSLDELRY
jgi:error-prone DNA polymerase